MQDAVISERDRCFIVGYSGLEWDLGGLGGLRRGDDQRVESHCRAGAGLVQGALLIEVLAPLHRSICLPASYCTVRGRGLRWMFHGF